MDQSFFNNQGKFKILIICIFIVVLSASYVYMVKDNESFVSIPEKYKKSNDYLANDSKIVDQDASDSEISNTAISLRIGKSLDLTIGNTYLITFSLKINVPPQFEKRQKLIAKYNTRIKPASGWAIAIRSIYTSQRLELYIQDEFERGGWYSLAPLNISQSEKVNLYILIKPGSYASAFLRGITDQEPYLKNLGLIDLTQLGEIKSLGNLQITSGQPKYDQFQGVVDDVKFFRIENFKNQNELQEQLYRDPQVFLSNFAAKCIISFSDQEELCEIKNINNNVIE